MEHKLRILVAEDDALTAMVLQLVLKADGHEVLGPVASMEGGIDVAAREPPDLALLDVTLTGEGDGVELARHLRDRCGTICLFVTALPAAALPTPNAAVGVLRKPYQPHEVLRSVETIQQMMAGEAVQVLPRGLRLFTPRGVRLTPPL